MYFFRTTPGKLYEAARSYIIYSDITDTRTAFYTFYIEQKKRDSSTLGFFFQKKPMLTVDECMAKKGWLKIFGRG